MGRRGTIAAVLAAALAGGMLPAGAVDDPPHITDIAGDANGLNTVGVELDTRPASEDRVDLLGVWFETAYVAIPVGEDGIRHEPTGLAIRMQTLGLPDRVSGFRTYYQVDATVAGCPSGFGADINPNPDTGGRKATPYWDQLDDQCPDGKLLFITDIRNPEWTATIDDSRAELRLHYPFSSLGPKQAEFLKVGSVLAAPQAHTRVIFHYIVPSNLDEPRIVAGMVVDSTPVGADFVIGSDVPPDVPCTLGCPEGSS